MSLGRLGPVGTGRFRFSLNPLGPQERADLVASGVDPDTPGLTRTIRRTEARARALSDEELHARIRALAERAFDDWKETGDPGLYALLLRAGRLLPDLNPHGKG